MQVKKEDVKARIIEAARQEFLEKGFEKASLRKIVKIAQTTTGNFYNYFPNKEALFSELVEEVYKMFIYVIDHHDDWQEDADFLFTNLTIVRERMKAIMMPLIHKLDYSFVLLMECSEGTQYSHVRQQFKDILAEHFLEHIDTKVGYPHQEMGIILSEQFISGLIQIIKTTEDTQKRCELIIEQVIFVAIGVMGLLQNT